MANVKISALPAATTVASTDLLPVVQGGATKQTTPDLLPLSAAAVAALAAKAGLASPAFTGSPTIGGTAVAKTSDITAAVNALVGGASTAYDTLGELAAQLASDENAAAALTTLVGQKSLSLPVNIITPTGGAVKTAVIGARNSVDASTGPITVALPTPTAVGQHLILERADASAVTANAITVTGTIRNAPSTVVLNAVGAAFEGALYIAESLTSWAIAASIKPRAVLDAAYEAKGSVAAQATTNAATYLARQGFQGFRARDFPGVVNIPTVGTGYTQTLSASGAASAITSAVHVMPSKDYFRVVGLIEPRWGTTFPDYQGWKATAYYPNGNTSAPPFALEYEIDSVAGVVELSTKGSGTKIQTLVNGQYVAAAPVTIPNDGGGYLVTINLGAGGRYRIRHEFEGNGIFFGLNIGPTDAVYAAPRRTIRAIWMGDSFGEPTISDTANLWGGLGLPTMFGWLTGWEVIHASKGGTGLVAPGTGVKFADRLTDVLTASPGADVFILQLSSNDSSATTAAFMTQLQSIIGSLKTAGFTQYGQIIVLGHWWAKQSQAAPSSTLDQNAQAKAWCRANGAVYLDTLTPDVTGAVTTTVAAAATPGQSIISLAAPVPAVSNAPNAWYGEYYIQIGNPGSTTIEVRKIATSGYSGTGPYPTNITTSLSYAHAVGEQVVQVGASPITGTGTIAAPTGSGNADRFVGSDSTHPTVLGHRWRAIAYVAKLAQAVNR